MKLFFISVFFVFGACVASAQAPASTSPLEWAKKKCSELGFKGGTERFGNCVLQLSRNDEAISHPVKPPTLPLDQFIKPNSALILKTFKDCSECPVMTSLASGQFLMGSKYDPFAITNSTSSSEQPQHFVYIKSFSIGIFEVTQDEWYSIMGTLPSKIKGQNFPVDMVSWDEAQEYLKKISQKTNKKYRLPTEAEWEYASRAGNQTAFSFGDDENQLGDFAWYNKNSNSSQPVGSKSPNKFGLFDTSGNVWELVEDCWNPTYVGAPVDGSAWLTGDCSKRVARGGSWSNLAQNLRSAYRVEAFSSNAQERYGFRVARDN